MLLVLVLFLTNLMRKAQNMLLPMHPECHNPSFGLATKARVYKGAGQNRAQESHFMLLGMQKNVKE
jgi:hypothetical protein